MDRLYAVFGRNSVLVASSFFLVASAADSFATDKTYYQGNTWSVSLVGPGLDNPYGDMPYCRLRHEFNEQQRVDLNFAPLEKRDDITIDLQHDKWSLGKDDSNSVAFMNFAGHALRVDFKQFSPTSALAHIDFETVGNKGITEFAQVYGAAFSTKSPTQPIFFVFGNDEFTWAIPPISREEAIWTMKSWENCRNGIQKMMGSDAEINQ